MKDWRIFVADTLVKWFKQIRILGWVRFRLLRIAYKVFWSNSPRNGEWDFILSWLKPLRVWQKPVTILDIGSTESLLIYELLHRGYDVLGIDQRPYQEPNSHTAICDVLNPEVKDFAIKYDYILAVSSIEHIGLGAYGDKSNSDGDKKAVEYAYKVIKDNGYFIITLPNKHLGTNTGRGYSYQDFENLILGLFRIVYFVERSNQICAVLVKYP